MWDLHNDVVDGDVDQFNEEPNEAHNGEANRRGHCNFLEFWEDEQEYSQLGTRLNTKQWATIQRLYRPFLSGFVHLFTSRMESLTNCRLGSTNCMTWSIFAEDKKASQETLC